MVPYLSQQSILFLKSEREKDDCMRAVADKKTGTIRPGFDRSFAFIFRVRGGCPEIAKICLIDISLAGSIGKSFVFAGYVVVRGVFPGGNRP